MEQYTELGDLSELKESVHLGDGAYATFDGSGYIITANHHEPDKATDIVYIDFNAMNKLLEFTRKTNQKIIESVL